MNHEDALRERVRRFRTFGPAAFEAKPELDAPPTPSRGRPTHHEKRAFHSRPSFGNRSPFGDRLGWSPEDPPDAQALLADVDLERLERRLRLDALMGDADHDWRKNAPDVAAWKTKSQSSSR